MGSGKPWLRASYGINSDYNCRSLESGRKVMDHADWFIHKVEERSIINLMHT